MKIKKRVLKERLIYSLILMVFLLVPIVYTLNIPEPNLEDIPDLSLDNFVEVTKIDVKIVGQDILLTAGCHRLDMVTGLEQIKSIAIALENLTMPRPNAHDLFVHSLRNFDISLLFVKIHSLIDGTYYAKLFFKQGNNILILDSRPSDAIAIAMRSGSPIYLNKELIGYAERIC